MLNVLHEYGGIFMEPELVCVYPLDELAWRYSFFSAFEPPSPYVELPPISTSIVGA